MQLSVTGRHVDITDSMKQYAEEKTLKLTKFYDRIEAIDVVNPPPPGPRRPSRNQISYQ